MLIDSQQVVAIVRRRHETFLEGVSLGEYVVQLLIEFGTFVLIRGIASTSTPQSWKNVTKKDLTELISNNVAPVVAKLIERYNVRIIRLSGVHEQFIAITKLVFPSIWIFVDYNVSEIPAEFQDFIICHELSHYKRKDPLVKLLLECLIAASFVALAIRVSLSSNSILGAALVALPIIGVGTLAVLLPVMRFIGRQMEFSADDFASRIVGDNTALRCLEDLKAEYRNRSLDSGWKDLDRRIERLRVKSRARSEFAR